MATPGPQTSRELPSSGEADGSLRAHESGLPPGLWKDAARATAGYAITLTLCLALGYRMQIPYGYFQFLDVRLLESRLWESILFLHSQPPILNLLLAGLLRLQSLSGWSADHFALIFHAALGAAAIPAMVFTAGTLIPDARRRRLLIGLLVFHPVFYMVLFEFFYTFHELVILAMLPCAAWFYLRSRSIPGFAGICALLIWLNYTRSLFHIAWALAILAFLTTTMRGRLAGLSHHLPRAEMVLMLVTTVILVAWPLKNWIIFDTFTSSTWQGYSLSKGLIEGLPPVDEIPRPAPPPGFDVPALAWDEKSDPTNSGRIFRNWNHYALIGEFEDRQRRAIAEIREHPRSLFELMGYYYWCFSRFTGRDPYTASFGTVSQAIPPAVDPWMRMYEALLVQEFRSPNFLRNPYVRDEPIRFWHVSGFFFTFPIIVLLVANKIRRVWSLRPLEARMAAILLFTVAWVFAMILLVDGDEANRIRTSTEPYTLMLALWLIPPGFFTLFRNRFRRAEASPRGAGAAS